jgi:hypothetical protein
MGANAYLYNLGWRPSTVKPGDKLTVKVDPLRNGTPGGLLVEAVTADGKALGRRPWTFDTSSRASRCSRRSSC